MTWNATIFQTVRVECDSTYVQIILAELQKPSWNGSIGIASDFLWLTLDLNSTNACSCARMWIKQIAKNACHQEVSRCRTRGVPQESTQAWLSVATQKDLYPPKIVLEKFGAPEMEGGLPTYYFSGKVPKNEKSWPVTCWCLWTFL